MNFLNKNISVSDFSDCLKILENVKSFVKNVYIYTNSDFHNFENYKNIFENFEITEKIDSEKILDFIKKENSLFIFDKPIKKDIIFYKLFMKGRHHNCTVLSTQKLSFVFEEQFANCYTKKDGFFRVNSNNRISI